MIEVAEFLVFFSLLLLLLRRYHRKKSSSKKGDSKQDFQRSEELARAQRKIERLEGELNQLNRQFEQLEYGTDEFADTLKCIKELKTSLEKAYAAWEKLEK